MISGENLQSYKIFERQPSYQNGGDLFAILMSFLFFFLFLLSSHLSFVLGLSEFYLKSFLFFLLSFSFIFRDCRSFVLFFFCFNNFGFRSEIFLFSISFLHASDCFLWNSFVLFLLFLSFFNTFLPSILFFLL